jgi:hypothetical protein
MEEKHMKTAKRVLAILLAMVMLMGIAVVGAHAEGEETEQTATVEETEQTATEETEQPAVQPTAEELREITKIVSPLITLRASTLSIGVMLFIYLGVLGAVFVKNWFATDDKASVEQQKKDAALCEKYGLLGEEDVYRLYQEGKLDDLVKELEKNESSYLYYTYQVWVVWLIKLTASNGTQPEEGMTLDYLYRSLTTSGLVLG